MTEKKKRGRGEGEGADQLGEPSLHSASGMAWGGYRPHASCSRKEFPEEGKKTARTFKERGKAGSGTRPYVHDARLVIVCLKRGVMDVENNRLLLRVFPKGRGGHAPRARLAGTYRKKLTVPAPSKIQP